MDTLNAIRRSRNKRYQIVLAGIRLRERIVDDYVSKTGVLK
jgi:hypothetical protein